MSINILSDEKIIEVYKDQNVSVERGLRFLKDPLFYVERRIRAAFKEDEAHIWNQKNRPTDNPDARWVFTIFEDVLLLYAHSPEGGTVQAMNLRAEHEIVINSLGEPYRKMYFL
ncbi:MAG: hypothetical protein ACOCXF_02430 [bacterium]